MHVTVIMHKCTFVARCALDIPSAHLQALTHNKLTIRQVC